MILIKSGQHQVPKLVGQKEMVLMEVILLDQVPMEKIKTIKALIVEQKLELVKGPIWAWLEFLDLGLMTFHIVLMGGLPFLDIRENKNQI